jgi:competence ComEA-like helix-hairpin-helix protein
MKLTQILVDYLTFSRTEQRGIMVLVSILFTMVVAYAVIPSLIPEKPPDFSQFEKEVTAFEEAMKLQDSLEGLRNQKPMHTRTGYALQGSDSTRFAGTKAKEVIIIELNSADTFDLQRLPGIGASYAKRIIRYRERLGGFNDKTQLLEVFGMDTVRYNMVKKNLAVNRDSIHKININNVAFKDLMKHPYFPFGITKSIILYRKDHKQFKTIEELKFIPGINDSIYRVMKVYVRVE